jgi:hypothetical protein
VRRGAEHLSEKQQARLAAGLAAGDPDDEVSVAWQCYQQLRPHPPQAHPTDLRDDAFMQVSVARGGASGAVRAGLNPADDSGLRSCARGPMCPAILRVFTTCASREA